MTVPTTVGLKTYIHSPLCSDSNRLEKSPTARAPSTSQASWMSSPAPNIASSRCALNVSRTRPRPASSWIRLSRRGSQRGMVPDPSHRLMNFAYGEATPSSRSAEGHESAPKVIGLDQLELLIL